jgi:hypothetical protein
LPSDVIAQVHMVFEVVLSRFVDRHSVRWSSCSADNTAFSALVPGDVIDANRVGDDVIDAFAAVGDLIGVTGERRMVPAKGGILWTGPVSKPSNVPAQCTKISASFLDSSLGFGVSTSQR